MDQRIAISTSISIVMALAAGGLGCKANLGNDSTDVAEGYQGSEYEENIVTGKERKDYQDQGKGISPKTLTSIEHTITSVYERDFERCLEDEMDRQETRFLRAVFTVEFTIATTGKVTAAKVLNIKASKQDAKGADLGAIDDAELRKCMHDSVMEWAFEPPPEVDYTHTYNGQVGEAF